jgi:3D (Asp-Asp-Asp) domain-containing protein
VRRRARLSHRVLAVVTLVTCGGAAAASGADSPSTLSQRAAQLRSADRTLAAQTHETLLSLYASDAAIARATARIDALQSDRARVERERASVRRRLVAARTTFRVAQRQLALRVHALYVTRPTDPLAVVLGASSIEGAVGQLESISRSAALDQRIVREARQTKSRLRSLTARLSRRDAELHELIAAAERVRVSLQAERDRRRSLVAELVHRRDARRSELERVEARARTLTSIAPAPEEVRAPVAAAPAARTLTVVATGYSGTGTTASGLPAGPGVVAVDPSLIPFGTRITIPGYGEGVAADTGTTVQGAVIDLWFATTAEARAWGRRTVLVTLH